MADAGKRLIRIWLPEDQVARLEEIKTVPGWSWEQLFDYLLYFKEGVKPPPRPVSLKGHSHSHPVGGRNRR